MSSKAASLQHSVRQDQPAKKKRTRLTQQAIVNAAAELFAYNGFGSTTLDDIAEQLGVTKPALYYHVKNKEEILRLIYLTVLTVSEEPLRRIVESSLSPLEKLRRSIEHQTAIAADRSPAMTVFYREQPHLTGPFAKEIILRQKAYEGYFERIIEEGQQAGVFAPTIDVQIAVFGLLGMCNGLSQWYKSGGRYSPEQVARVFNTMISSGLVHSSHDTSL
jgi:TetR/AcrR family transcriptional regulator, cholesterol catabolism regulator